MPNVYVDVDLDDFDDEDLIKELEYRGYDVGGTSLEMKDVIWRYKAGYKGCPAYFGASVSRFVWN